MHLIAIESYLHVDASLRQTGDWNDRSQSFNISSGNLSPVQTLCLLLLHSQHFNPNATKEIWTEKRVINWFLHWMIANKNKLLIA